MAHKIRVLGIVGSLREDSYNRQLLEEAVRLAPEEMTIEIYEELGEIPAFNEDVEAQGDPEPVQTLKQAIADADALLIATPEYNYSVTGVLKNAIDWASKPTNDGPSPLAGKPTAVMGASPGMVGTARAQIALRQSFVYTQTPVLPGPEVLVSSAHERFDDNGRLTDEMSKKFVADLLVRLSDFTHQLQNGQSHNGAG